jgi:hypothetical protein
VQGGSSRGAAGPMRPEAALADRVRKPTGRGLFVLPARLHRRRLGMSRRCMTVPARRRMAVSSSPWRERGESVQYRPAALVGSGCSSNSASSGEEGSGAFSVTPAHHVYSFFGARQERPARRVCAGCPPFGRLSRRGAPVLLPIAEAVIGTLSVRGNGACVGGPVLVPGERMWPATRVSAIRARAAGAAPRPRLSPVITGGPSRAGMNANYHGPKKRG